MLKKLSTCILICFSLVAHAGTNESLIPDSVIAKLLDKYTEEEKELIEVDLNLIRNLVFRGRTPAFDRPPVYLATAGAPLSRKTTILEKIMSDEWIYRQTVYLDPDQRALKFMVNTYIARSLNNLEIYKTQDVQAVRRSAYFYWRDASNYITNTLLNEAFRNRLDIAHGTTLTGSSSALMLEKLQDAGYEITLLLCFASEDFRKDALEFRNEKQGFYQSSSEDFVEKARLFKLRMDTYSCFADQMRSFCSGKLGDEIKPSAYWWNSHGFNGDLFCESFFNSTIGNEPHQSNGHIHNNRSNRNSKS